MAIQDSKVDRAAHDAMMAAEQEHLSQVYGELLRMRQALSGKLDAIDAEAAADKGLMAEELTLNATSFDEALETYAAINAANRVIEGYNMAAETAQAKLADVELLLRQPYFAKIVLRYGPDKEPRELYIGAAGVADEDFKRLVVDWRSPVAEVYYNQANGPTSYQANGRTIEVDLLLRRQFDIERNVLRACFDTTVAIEDPLLLASLSTERSTHMKAITTTIQREQNAVIRHEDVPVLLVSGVAGSGKTSVLLQRIAYLFYAHRDDLDPDQVHLMSPNPVFTSYIQNVLPEMGERNPHTRTWDQLASDLLPAGMSPGKGDVEVERLYQMDAGVADLHLTQADFAQIAQDGTRFVTPNQVDSLMHRFERVPVGPRRITLVREELLKRFDQRLKRMAASESAAEDLEALSIEEQLRIFHETLHPQTDAEVRELALRLLRDRYADARRAIECDEWLRIDRIAMRLVGATGVAPVEWLYAKMALTGLADAEARYVMIDEVQDYTAAQLACLAKYFRRAHFMLLGDENQAIHDASITFDQASTVFERLCGPVSRCDLMISYRSTPQITALFARLANDEAMQIRSVHPDGPPPAIVACDSQQARYDRVAQLIDEAQDGSGLTAVIVPWKAQLRALRSAFGDRLPIIEDRDSLPEQGVFATTLKLAKGLEFDQVILPDVSSAAYPASDGSRRRLYTAISRATHRVWLLYEGELSAVLSDIGMADTA